MSDTATKYERVKITWPTSNTTFTVDDVVALNIDPNGKPLVSKVTIQTKINAGLDSGSVVIEGTKSTRGRPKVVYKILV